MVTAKELQKFIVKAMFFSNEETSDDKKLKQLSDNLRDAMCEELDITHDVLEKSFRHFDPEKKFGEKVGKAYMEFVQYCDELFTQDLFA